MIPGLNPRDVAKAMKKLGIKQDNLEAKKVIIILEDKQLIFENPQVSKVNMMGEETYQVIGQPTQQSLNQEIEITEEDLKTVMNQTNCSKEKAFETIKKNNGNLAESIIELSN